MSGKTPAAPKPAAPVLALVPYLRSEDTIECLQELLGEAIRGELVGLAFAAMYRRRQYIVDTTGEAYRNPSFARGAVSALSDTLGKRARGE